MPWERGIEVIDGDDVATKTGWTENVLLRSLDMICLAVSVARGIRVKAQPTQVCILGGKFRTLG